jgi:predicted CxxxxCH...CXXCH cytochrome family protein
LVTWKDQIASLVSDHCASCHGPAQPAGNYRMDTYLDVLAGGLDAIPNAIAGDPTSRILQVLETEDGTGPHAALQANLPMLRAWVVDSKLAYFTSSVHGGGILDPAQPDFHGNLAHAPGFAMATCQSCHGADLSGGPAQASCQSCHDRGPADCAKCHTSVLGIEPHRTHVKGGGLGQKYACVECHDHPRSLGEPGHFAPAGSAVRASVAFTGPVAGGHGGGWDPQTLTCKNVYCHSVSANDTSALRPTPSWSPDTTIQCGSCHGLPPANGLHPAVTTIQDCARCHPSTIDRSGAIIGGGVDGGVGTNHLNGVVNVP